jgi:prolyl-tRNA editing enzyme YbaK/EbsC (Cys-tRNA(Pro) deacylase)|tara:strand:- start:1187 stop:1375 length:189 start_codon:yes stop_codon:yes gene_type:complete
MPEIRFTVTKKLNELILEVSEGLGVDKSDYVKSLILTDLKNARKSKILGANSVEKIKKNDEE